MFEWFIPEFYRNKKISILDLKSEESNLNSVVYSLNDFREKIIKKRKIKREYGCRVLDNYFNDKV